MKKNILLKSGKTILMSVFLSLWAGIYFFSFAASTATNIPYITKSKIRAVIPAGKQVLGEIMVENPTAEGKAIHIYLEDWYYVTGGEGAKEFLPAGTLPSSCVSWISFTPADFIVPPFGRQKVSYSINVPVGASGGHYAAMFFETKIGSMPSSADAKATDAGIDLKARIASLFYVEVEGANRRSADLSNLIVENDPQGKILIQMDLTNTGNVDIITAGTFNVIDNMGMVYARGEFNKAYTFPQDKAKLTASWNKPLPKGRYDLVITLDLGKAAQEAGMPGKGPVITKELVLEIGESGKVLRASQNSQ